MKYDFLKTFRLNLEYEFDYKYYFLETFRFDYEYAFDYEYDFLETFRFDYEYDFLRFGTRNVTTIFSAIFVVNRRTAMKFDPTTILRIPVMNSVVPKSRTC